MRPVYREEIDEMACHLLGPATLLMVGTGTGLSPLGCNHL